MHKVVLLVFKVIGISIIIMLLADVSFYIVDRKTAYSRMDDVAATIQDTLSRNNSIPTALAGLYEEEFKDIVDHSNVVTKIEWNLNQSMSTSKLASPAPPINEDGVQPYGSKLYLVIRVTYKPSSILFTKKANSNGSFISRINLPDQTVDYVYEAPALRNLK